MSVEFNDSPINILKRLISSGKFRDGLNYAKMLNVKIALIFYSALLLEKLNTI